MRKKEGFKKMAKGGATKTGKQKSCLTGQSKGKSYNQKDDWVKPYYGD